MARKSLRERFEECYTAVPVPADNEKGFKIKYVYCAPWYIWEFPERCLLKKRMNAAILSAAGVLADAFALTRRTPVNSFRMAFLPMALILCLHILEGMGVAKFISSGDRATKMQYQEADLLLTSAPLGRGMIGCILAAAAVVMGFKTGIGPAAAAAAGYLTAAGTAFLLHREYRRISCHIAANHDLEEYEKAPNLF